MLSKRLETIATFIEQDDIVLDVGCDHGYLDIYLKENNLCKDVYASDISENAIKVSQNNFEKRNLDIKTFVSDGFKNIPVTFNTAVISGVGTNTILDIIKHKNTPNKLILSSHNNLDILRKSLNKKGYSLIDEKVVFEKEHYYVVMLWLKGKQKLSTSEIKFGISKNYEYYNYLLNKNLELIKEVPINKRKYLEKDIKYLNKLIEKM